MAEKKNTAARVYDLALPITEEVGVYLWDVRFEKEGSSWFLRLIIDADDGVTIDDCEAVSRPLSDKLDEEDFISQNYYLEVSSPGFNRELRRPDHFEVCIGDAVLVRTIRPKNGERNFNGVLTSYDNGTFTIEQEDHTTLSFETSECSFVKLDDDDLDF